MSYSKFELFPEEINQNGCVICPNLLAGIKQWNGHPRVYLDVAQTGTTKCPYCGTVYKLKRKPAANAPKMTIS